ncbi:MAG: nicotinate-nucleotide adenylyltransferase [Nitrospira sp.]|jgi:nicotinate-nucleotide adenylyltransferase|nr:nicotinate-nucleotide adenylyltransferase [Nitrospira sp.]MBP6607238.1 nicotinate-nucleotide adenylyltransferase [Nitrospira sp.]HQY56797.1 nicotinate-nucleotide adenylyltransferase [Nitrospira sp.]
MRLGLFGGSFNPIHRCHLSIAQSARQLLHLDRVLFIPTGDPPHKQPGTLATASHRHRMVQLAIQDTPEFALTDMEINRSGKSYSIDTIRALRQEYGPDVAFFFIIGLDAFLDLPSWKEADALLNNCHFVVISRPSTTFQAMASIPLFQDVPNATLIDLDDARQDRADVAITNGQALTFLRLPPCDVSASEIRARLRTGVSLANLLPAPVESYILREGLYREDSERL